MTTETSDERTKPNHDVANITRWMHGLSYLDLSELARQLIVALDDDSGRGSENIPPAEIDKMARAILDGTSFWNEITNS